MVPDWTRRKLGDFTQRIKRINEAGEELPPLSVTKGRGVMLQSDKFKKRIATDLRKYLVVHRGEFAFDPMSLYYGAVGRVGTVDRGVISPDYVAFEPDESVDHLFLDYLLRSPEMHDKYEVVAEGGSQFGKRRRVYWSVFTGIDVTLPPLPEQRKIADILSSVDNTIEKTQAVIDQLEVVKKGLLGALLTQGIPGRHSQFRPLPEEWRLGRIAAVSEVPIGWQLVKLTSIARLESGHTPSRKHPEYWNGGVPWVSLHDSKALDVPVINDTAEHISSLGLDNSSARLLPPGTVVFSRTATIGKSTILGREMATSQDFANYVCGDRLHNRYLMHYFRANQGEWERLKAGSTHKTLYMPTFEQLQILLPPIDEQKAIAQIADDAEERIAAERDHLVALKELKSALLDSLISGRVRISVPAQEAA